jgi:hypothetical protein
MTKRTVKTCHGIIRIMTSFVLLSKPNIFQFFGRFKQAFSPLSSNDNAKLNQYFWHMLPCLQCSPEILIWHTFKTAVTKTSFLAAIVTGSNHMCKEKTPPPPWDGRQLVSITYTAGSDTLYL